MMGVGAKRALGLYRSCAPRHAAVLLFARPVERFLYGVSSRDPIAYVTVTAVLMATALAAASFPHAVRRRLTPSPHCVRNDRARSKTAGSAYAKEISTMALTHESPSVMKRNRPAEAGAARGSRLTLQRELVVPTLTVVAVQVGGTGVRAGDVVQVGADERELSVERDRDAEPLFETTEPGGAQGFTMSPETVSSS